MKEMTDFRGLLTARVESGVEFIIVDGAAAMAHGSVRGLNFMLTTTLGALDLPGEIAGGGGYDELLPHPNILSMFGMNCR